MNMNDLFRRAVNIFKALKAKEIPSKQSQVEYSKRDYRYIVSTRYYPSRFFVRGIVGNITERGYLLKNKELAETIHFHGTREIEAWELYEQWLQLKEVLSPPMLKEARIRYGQKYNEKLVDLDRRMIALEQGREVDKKIRLSQTRKLEYLEADVESLKIKEKGQSYQADKVQFTVVFQHLLENVDIMEEMRNEPIEFEQARASFLSQLRGLEALKPTQDPYFIDLLTIIDVGVTYTDGTELTEESFNVLRDAVRSMSREVTISTLKELRKRFRESGINILKPLDLRANVGELLKEIFE